MTYNNKMKIQFLNKSANEGFARVSVAAFVTQLDVTLEQLADIKTAVSEAVTNSIVHGYENMVGYVTLECELDDGTVHITVSDCGRGISDIELARKPLYTSRPELERSGMGFTVMETFMDKVEVTSALGLGTVVKMSKKLQG
ncbi:MAG: anti-sigma F factor [Clostridia bacterium]|nr:anti-sigma F factor [Clostridia bacterium]